MTREEAIHELQEDKSLYETEVCHAGDGSPDGRLLEALDMAIEALHREEAEERGWCHRIKPKEYFPSAEAEWIPCSERLPSEGQMVLTTIRGHDVIIPQDGETLEEAIKRVWNEVCYVSVGFIGSDGWYGADGFPQIVHPIAWMPLPKPYKAERREP